MAGVCQSGCFAERNGYQLLVNGYRGREGEANRFPQVTLERGGFCNAFLKERGLQPAAAFPAAGWNTTIVNAVV
jgi:hypothetical protein